MNLIPRLMADGDSTICANPLTIRIVTLEFGTPTLNLGAEGLLFGTTDACNRSYC